MHIVVKPGETLTIQLEDTVRPDVKVTAIVDVEGVKLQVFELRSNDKEALAIQTSYPNHNE